MLYIIKSKDTRFSGCKVLNASGVRGGYAIEQRTGNIKMQW